RLVRHPYTNHLLPWSPRVEGPGRLLQALLRGGDEPPSERLDAVRVQIDSVLGAQHQFEQALPGRESPLRFILKPRAQVVRELRERARRGLAGKREVGPRGTGPRGEPASQVVQ